MIYLYKIDNIRVLIQCYIYIVCTNILDFVYIKKKKKYLKTWHIKKER